MERKPDSSEPTRNVDDIQDLEQRDERKEVPADEAESLKGGKVSFQDIHFTE